MIIILVFLNIFRTKIMHRYYANSMRTKTRLEANNSI